MPFAYHSRKCARLVIFFRVIVYATLSSALPLRISPTL
ncbi:unnamed protein product [Spirodela intermedia]|uniref:Uncharacterized protein n=1 Tax=Spirodela intermedia TaxID=51605 RepID=A0A7I8JMM3_SPIIN|nr:unnamed protein product [Spirodela intermedia]CAA6671350.1 unnamed protein product [Spirodela intermedia]